jgi:parallel beta-helix repeat protein
MASSNCESLFVLLCPLRLLHLTLRGICRSDWRDTFIKIDSITRNTKGYNVTRNTATKPQYPFTKGCRFYAVAALELLDAPGEYHVDKTSGLLHFLPPTPLTPGSDLMVSVLNTVVQADTSHTTFIGLTMSVSRDLIFSTTNRAGTTVGNNVTVENCILSNSGTSCVHLQGSNNTARNNTVFGCGTSGIAVISGSVNTLQRGNSSVVANRISQCSRIQRTYTPGVGE